MREERRTKLMVLGLVMVAAIAIIIMIVMLINHQGKINLHNKIGETVEGSLTQDENVELSAKELRSAIDFINTLPMQLNFLKKSFNSEEELSNEERLQLTLAYMHKNKKWQKIAEGEKSIDEIEETSLSLKNIFGKEITITGNNAITFFDRIGAARVNYENGKYQFEYNDANVQVNRDYSRYVKSTVQGDTYYIYLKQGYIEQKVNGKEPTESIDADATVTYYLRNYTDGSSIFFYQNKASQVLENYNFENKLKTEYGIFAEKMQTYEYGLKKDASGQYYLVSFKIVSD